MPIRAKARERVEEGGMHLTNPHGHHITILFESQILKPNINMNYKLYSL